MAANFLMKFSEEDDHHLSSPVPAVPGSLRMTLLSDYLTLWLLVHVSFISLAGLVGMERAETTSSFVYEFWQVT